MSSTRIEDVDRSGFHEWLDIEGQAWRPHVPFRSRLRAMRAWRRWARYERKLCDGTVWEDDLATDDRVRKSYRCWRCNRLAGSQLN